MRLLSLTLHLDHFDDAAKQALPKDIKMFVQNEEDAAVVKEAGFKNVEVLTKNTVFQGIQLIKTKGEHGRGEILKRTGLVCGVVFKHKSEKTLYVAGDTVWYSAVGKEINTHKPDVIVVNGGDNQFLEDGSLVMGKEDIYQVLKRPSCYDCFCPYGSCKSLDVIKRRVKRLYQRKKIWRPASLFQMMARFILFKKRK